MLSLIVARARNGAIGKDNEIPWHLPEDLKLFQRETLGGAIIMGRNTWESLPVKPLGRRLNCVVSRNSDLTEMVRTDVNTAVRDCYAAGYTRVYGIGGQAIYRDLLAHADRMLISEVDLEIEDADAFFPEFDESCWTELRRHSLRKEGPACVLRELMRKPS